MPIRFFYDQPFSRYRIAENRIVKAPNDPQNDLKHLNVKSTLYALNTHPWGPNFSPFHSTTSSFQDVRQKIRKAANDSQMTPST